MSDVDRPWDRPDPERSTTSVGRGPKLAAALAAILLVGWCSVETAKNASEDEGGDEFGAKGVCQEFVKDRLKSPSTADFSDESAVSTSDTEWSVTGSVDSQNSFGASVRNRYTCEVEYTGDENWNLVDLQTSGN